MSTLVSMYFEGASTKTIAERFGVSAGTAASYLRRAGVTLRPPGFRRGTDHHAWAGGRHIDDSGYVRVWLSAGSPFSSMAQRHGSSAGGYVLEHRLVLAKKLGRCLAEDETVHHKDGNRQNNKLRNLQLRKGTHGKGSVFRCCDCGSYNVKAAALN